VLGRFVLPESLALAERSGLLGLSAVGVLRALAHEALPSVFVLYAGYRFAWGPTQVGACLAAVGVCSAVVQGGLIRLAPRRLSDEPMLVFGLVFGAAGFVL